MFKYTLDEINQLGEKDAKYGITYWAKTLEEEVPVMFNSMEVLAVSESSPIIQITAEERVEKQSAKGNNYYRLKKVKVISISTTSSVEPTTSSPPTFEKEVLDCLDTLTAMVTDLSDKLLRIDQAPSQQEIDKVVDDGEAVDLKDIPF